MKDKDHTIVKVRSYPMRYIYNILTLNTMFQAEENLRLVNRELNIHNTFHCEDNSGLDDYIADQNRIIENRFDKVGYPAYYDKERNINQLLGG